MGTVYLLLAIGAFLPFLVTSLISVALMAVWPLLALTLMGAALAGGRLILAARMVRDVFSLFRMWGGYTSSLLSIVFGPLFQREDAEKIGYDWRRLPQTWAFVEDVAKRTGVRMVDDVLITTEANCAVTETGGLLFGKRRHLILGLPILYTMTLPEIEAVIAHEFGHFKGNHPVARRLVFRMLQALIPVHVRVRSTSFFLISPLYWSTLISITIFESIYIPWRHLNEFNADQLAAQTVGSNHAISMLRKLRDELPAVEVSVQKVLHESKRLEAAPTHLYEAAARLARHMDPKIKRRLAGQVRGDPLDDRLETHPSTEKRIAALHGVPSKASTVTQVAAAAFPDAREVEHSLTRQATPHTNRYVPPQSFVTVVLSEMADEPPGAIARSSIA